MASGDSLWDNNIRFRRSLNKYFQIVANLCQVSTYIFVIDIGVGMEIYNDAPYNAILSSFWTLRTALVFGTSGGDGIYKLLNQIIDLLTRSLTN